MVPKNLENTIVIIGSTASGKSELAHFISKYYNSTWQKTAIINLDAFQIYKELNAGTAKPTIYEQQEYEYHGLNICNIQENIDALKFSEICIEYKNEILNQNKIAICVGGSGLYLRAFLHGLDEVPSRSPEIRNEIRKKAEDYGWTWCYEWLKKIDLKRSEQIHQNDKIRIERALEIYLSTGKPMSEFESKNEVLHEQKLNFPCSIIYTDRPKDDLKNRIQKRVVQMIENGWIEEVENLYKKYGENLFEFYSMRAIGYIEILNFIKNKDKNKNELIEKINSRTWQYAKRQITWNSKEKKHYIWHTEEQKLIPYENYK